MIGNEPNWAQGSFARPSGTLLRHLAREQYQIVKVNLVRAL